MRKLARRALSALIRCSRSSFSNSAMMPPPRGKSGASLTVRRAWVARRSNRRPRKPLRADVEAPGMRRSAHPARDGERRADAYRRALVRLIGSDLVKDTAVADGKRRSGVAGTIGGHSTNQEVVGCGFDRVHAACSVPESRAGAMRSTRPVRRPRSGRSSFRGARLISHGARLFRDHAVRLEGGRRNPS